MSRVYIKFQSMEPNRARVISHPFTNDKYQFSSFSKDDQVQIIAKW